MSHPHDGFTGIIHPEVRACLDSLGAQAQERGGAAMSEAERALHQRLEARAMSRGFPLVGRESGRWLFLLSQMIGARRVLELGSGFGYSAFWFARGVGPGGEVHGTERDEWEHQAFDELWADEPLRARVTLHRGDALELLERLPGPWDIVFVDIHKAGYPDALRLAVPRIRPGGLLLADNVLWGGKVARPLDPADTSGTDSLLAFNRAIHEHPSLHSLILPCGDGLSVSRKLTSPESA